MFQDEIARGAALLDEKKPGWVEKQELDKLNLAHDRLCVLGQTDGNY